MVAPAVREPRPRKKALTALPISCPTERDLLWAQGRFQGLGIDVDQQAEAFRSHHLAKDNRFADWSQAWRLWVTKAIDWRRDRQAGRQARSGVAWAIGGDR